jgi:hypothetical protein
VHGNRAFEEMSPETQMSQGLQWFRYADFFSRVQLLPPQQPALADFIFAQQSPLQSPDLEQQDAFAAVWSFASGCALALSLFMSLQQAQSLHTAFSLLHESPLQQAFFPEQHFPFLPLQQVCAFCVVVSEMGTNF